MLGSHDENDVQGYAGTPVNVNGLTFDYRADIGAAGAAFPRRSAYYVAVDSGRDVFTGKSLPGQLRPALVGQRPDARRPLADDDASRPAGRRSSRS